MSFAWTPERVRFMANADAHTDYYQKLARWLAPWLPKNGHVCDAGCGLGSLSLALCARGNGSRPEPSGSGGTSGKKAGE